MTVDGKTVVPSAKPVKIPRLRMRLAGGEYLQFNSLNTSYYPGFTLLKNLSVNGRKIDPGKLSAGCPQYPDKVYPAAKCVEK